MPLLFIIGLIIALVLFVRDALDVPAEPNGLDSEYTCEVVRITRIDPHPNADKLELAHFAMRNGDETGYEVVVGKGEFHPRDLATYLSVDCIVPLDRRQFAFLKTRQDAQTKTHFRLRAARLRGVYSQGLLVPVTGTPAVGTSMSKELGVDYHRAPEAGQPTVPGQKKVKSQPAPVYGVTSLKKMPHVFPEGTMVHVTEKVHGANFRFGWVPRKRFGIRLGYRFFVGSHQVEKGDGSAGFYGSDLWSEYAQHNELAAKTKEHRGLVFYGELFGRTPSGQPIQDLTYGRSEPDMVVFDVLRLSGHQWLPLEERMPLIRSLGLETPPVLGIGLFNEDWIAHLAEGQTEVPDAPKGHMREGVVVENITDPSLPSSQRKAKYVGQGYLLRKEAA